MPCINVFKKSSIVQITLKIQPISDPTLQAILLYLAANDKVDLWLPKVVRSEVENITRSIDDIRSRFENALVDSEVLESTMSPENMKSIVDEIIFDFSTWAGNSDEIEAEAVSDEVKSSMDAFLTQHNEIYDELTKMRQHYEGKNIRTEIDGKKIYPQHPIERLCNTLRSYPIAQSTTLAQLL